MNVLSSLVTYWLTVIFSQADKLKHDEKSCIRVCVRYISTYAHTDIYGHFIFHAGPLHVNARSNADDTHEESTAAEKETTAAEA